MSDLIFKAASMTDVYSESDKPKFYTVLCKKKGSRKCWSYCGDGKCDIIRVTTLKEARKIASKLRKDYLSKSSKESKK